MEIVILIALAVCIVVVLIRSSSYEPVVRGDTYSVETVVISNGDIIDHVDLRDVASLDQVDMIETSDLHLIYADEHEPYNRLKAKRDR